MRDKNTFPNNLPEPVPLYRNELKDIKSTLDLLVKSQLPNNSQSPTSNIMETIQVLVFVEKTALDTAWQSINTLNLNSDEQLNEWLVRAEFIARYIKTRLGFPADIGQ